MITRSVFAASAALLFALAPMSSKAGLILTLDDLSTVGTDVTVVDGAISDILSQSGQVGYAGSVGTWALSFTAGTGYDVSDIWGIDLSTLSVSSSSGGTLRISLTETDLGYTPGPFTVSSAIGGTTNGTVSYKAYADDSNAAFGTGTALFSGLGTGLAFAGSGATTLNLSNPFSLTLVADIAQSGRSITSFDFTSQVPEPASIALCVVALLGAGAATRRRQSASQAT